MLRQYRVKPGSACIDDDLHRAIDREHCNPDFTTDTQDKGSYIPPGWEKSWHSTNLDQEHSKSFAYDGSAGSFIIYWGIYNTYKGNGYVFNFGETAQEAIENIDKIVNLMWIDR